MKKFTLFFFTLLALALGFQACDNTKTYAEMLEEEKDAINAFIKERGFTVISQSEFYAKDSVTAENEYVQLASGVYMNIVKKGTEGQPIRYVQNNDEVLVRFSEYDILGKQEGFSNLNTIEVDAFRYTVTSSSIAGIFTEGYMLYYGTSVPAGWLVALSYVGDGGRVNLIVPSKMGHSTAMSYVYPYFYEIRKIQIY